MTKVVLITGASSGLGKATASYLLANNYRVFGTSRDPQKYIPDINFDLLTFDLNQPETAQKLVNQVMHKVGRIDVLINNAGAGITGPIEETDVNSMQSHFSTNLFGPLSLDPESIACNASTKIGFDHQYYLYRRVYGSSL